jgi:hypothetical protein
MNNCRSKYHSKKIQLPDGVVFDSRKEYARWLELSLLQKVGKITDLKRQVKFVLIPAQYEPDTIGKRGGVRRGKLIERECSYTADFTYTEDGKTVVEDTKGFKTPEYRLKKKMLLYFHGIRIKET